MKSPKKIKTIDDYIEVFPKNVAARLQAIRKIVHQLAPDAKEVISYHMPAFKLNGILIYFAGYEHHIGFYPYPSALKAFKQAASKYKTGKGSIQFLHEKPLPLPLIRKIISYRAKEKRMKKFDLAKNSRT